MGVASEVTSEVKSSEVKSEAISSEVSKVSESSAVVITEESATSVLKHEESHAVKEEISLQSESILVQESSTIEEFVSEERKEEKLESIVQVAEKVTEES